MSSGAALDQHLFSEQPTALMASASHEVPNRDNDPVPHNVDAGRNHADYVTYARAAQILGIHVSNVPKLVTRGEIRSRGTRGPQASLLRTDVEAVLRRRKKRRQEMAARQAATPARPATAPPDDAHEWLNLEQAASVIGISPQAVGKRAKKGTIPHVRDGVRVWIREDHAQIASNARAARRVLTRED